MALPIRRSRNGRRTRTSRRPAIGEGLWSSWDSTPIHLNLTGDSEKRARWEFSTGKAAFRTRARFARWRSKMGWRLFGAVTLSPWECGVSNLGAAAGRYSRAWLRFVHRSCFGKAQRQRNSRRCQFVTRPPRKSGHATHETASGNEKEPSPNGERIGSLRQIAPKLGNRPASTDRRPPETDSGVPWVRS